MSAVRSFNVVKLSLVAAALALVVGCATTSAELGNEVAVPKSEYVDLADEDWSDVSTALNIARDEGASSDERAAAYLFVADANLLLWSQLLNQLEALDEGQGALYDALTKEGRIYFMQAHRARARSWAVRSSNQPDYIVAKSDFEQRFSTAWDLHREPAKAYAEMVKLLAEVIAASRAETYITSDFLSDLRYSAAIFYTLLDKPAGDMVEALDVTGGDEAEAVRFLGDVATLYDRLAAEPQNAADAYRAIAQSKPTTRAGYEAQVAVLEQLKKQQRLGAMDAGSADEFDASSAGLDLFESVNRDLNVLVEMNTHRDKWLDKKDEGSNVDSTAEELVRNFTVRMHGLAQQQENLVLFELAVNAYDNYHMLFPSSGYRYDMLYFEAEALSNLGQYDRAYQRYKEALGTSAHGDYREEIIRDLVMTAYKRCVTSPLPARAADAKTEMPEVHRDFISSGEQFLTVLEEADQGMSGFVRYEIIRRHHLYGEVLVAQPLLEAFMKNYADHPQAPKAAIVWLDLLARSTANGSDRDGRELERAIEKVRLKPPIFADPTVKAKLESVSSSPPKFDNLVPE